MAIPFISFGLPEVSNQNHAKKRKREVIEQQVDEAAQAAIDKSEELDQENPKKKVRFSRMLKELNPLIEMQRHDAYVLGSLEQRCRQFENLQETSPEMIASYLHEDLSRQSPYKLNKKQSSLIENIAKNISPQASEQVKELFLLLKNSHHSHRVQKQLIELASSLIDAMPNYILNTEIEVSQILGELLLVVDTDISLAIDALSEKSIEKGLRQIASGAKQIIKDANKRVQEHFTNHHHFAIQGADEALIKKMSIEMASLMLLSTGSINVGIRELVCELLIPEKIANYEGVLDIQNILQNICDDEEIKKSISCVKPPESHENPSDLAIRVSLGIPFSEKITGRDAQIFLLSALLSHVRQAMAGTCFTTCFLIKSWYENLDFVVADLVQCIENGYVTRLTSSQQKTFPFQPRVTPEYLDTLIKADKEGRICSTQRYEIRETAFANWPKVALHSYLYNAPGIKSVCLAMNIANPKAAVLSAIGNLPKEFSVKQLIVELANIAYSNQERRMYVLRSQSYYNEFTKKQLIDQGLYAFGSQTNDLLLRAYEQIGTVMVNYFSEEGHMPTWIYWTMNEILKVKAHGQSIAFQNMYRELLKDVFLPMIARMKYRYNHNYEDNKVLFNDGNHGIDDNSTYGYELWDSGLPGDFRYSDDLYKQSVKEPSVYYYPIFHEVQPASAWKSVDTQEKFQLFLVDVVNETAANHMEALSDEKKALLDSVRGKMCEDINDPKFIERNVFQLFGYGHEQKKAWSKNKFTMDSTPWKFRWGGDFDAVQKTFFSLDKEPSRLKPFNGTQKDVLAKCINFIKKQPEEILDGYRQSYERIIITSPVHAFLLTPGEQTFQNAWESEMATNEYIETHVIQPGFDVASSKLNAKARRELIAYVAENQWYCRSHEEDDFERLQLTEASQEAFDKFIVTLEDKENVPAESFVQELCQIVFDSRVCDVNIAERNKRWESRFTKILNKQLLTLIPDDQLQKAIPQEAAAALIDFARNHKDSRAFSKQAADKFRLQMAVAPKDATVREFRKLVVDIASEIHEEDKGLKDNQWASSFCKFIDTKLFRLLPDEDRKKIIDAGIITHDSNWKVGIHNCSLMFTVNPASGQLELCKYVPDLESLSFMSQDGWFPTGKRHGYWQFPDNYRVYSEEPLFQKRKIF